MQYNLTFLILKQLYRHSIFTTLFLLILSFIKPAIAIEYNAKVTNSPILLESEIPVFSTVQGAINAAPNDSIEKFVILIEPGIYHERVNINKKNISLVGIGKSPQDTVISFDLYAGYFPPGEIKSIGTFQSATMEVNTSDFYAENLTIENAFDYPSIEKLDDSDAGKVSGKQAVALTIGVKSNRSTFNNIVLKGYQDTLFVDGGVSYFYNSKIYGHVDFIFGGGNALFEQSTIINQRRYGSFKHTGYITAPSTLLRQKHGLTFIDCRLEKAIGVPDKSVPLGRPWHPTTQFKNGRYANPNAIGNAVFIRSFLDSHITDEGWSSMHGTARDGTKKDEFHPQDSRFFEYKNYGPGAKQHRDRRQLTTAQASNYTKDKILNGWQPVLNASTKAQFLPFKHLKDSETIAVTNLNTSGPGSLSSAININKPRRIVFQVAGIIDLQGQELVISHPNISIHGQTAPFPGITLIKGGLAIETDNVLVEHISVRPGDEAVNQASTTKMNGITIRSEQAFNVMIDHVSVSWASGKNIAIESGIINGYAGAPHHIGIKNSIISEALDNPLNQRGNLSEAMSVGDFAENIFIHGNLFANNDYQQPYLGGSTQTTLTNNVIYNPGFTGIESYYKLEDYTGFRLTPSDPNITVINNLLLKGSNSASSAALVHHYGNLSIKGNAAMNTVTKKSLDNNQLLNGNFKFSDTVNNDPKDPLLIPAVSLLEWITKHVGSRPEQRNSIDSRLIKQILNGEGNTIQSQKDVGDYPTQPLERLEKNND